MTYNLTLTIKTKGKRASLESASELRDFVDTLAHHLNANGCLDDASLRFKVLSARIAGGNLTLPIDSERTRKR